MPTWVLADFTEDLRVLARGSSAKLFVFRDDVLPPVDRLVFPLRVRRLLGRDKLTDATEAVVTDKPCPAVTGLSSINGIGGSVGRVRHGRRSNLSFNRRQEFSKKVPRQCLSKGPLIVRAVPCDIELVESRFSSECESW